MKNRKVIQEKLKEYIESVKGKHDQYCIRNNYGISYNDIFEYVSLYEITLNENTEEYEVTEITYQYDYEIENNFGRNFFKVSDDTKLKKAKKIIEELCY